MIAAVTHDQALAAARHVLDAAAGPVSVVVVDTHGEVIAAVAMTGAARDTYLNARRKAYIAARSDALTTRRARRQGRRLPDRARELRSAVQLLPRRRRRPSTTAARVGAVGRQRPARRGRRGARDRGRAGGGARCCLPRFLSQVRGRRAPASAAARPAGRSRAAGGRAGRRASEQTASGRPPPTSLPRAGQRRPRPQRLSPRGAAGREHGENPLRPPRHAEEHDRVGGDRGDGCAHHPVDKG